MCDVSIITVNYNGSDDTLAMVASIKEHTSVDFEIIILDNDSAPREKQKLQALQNDPAVTLIFNETNDGFATGNMLAAAKATGRYLFFLNNDTLLLNDVIGILHATALKNPDIGLLAPQLYDTDHKRTTTFREFPSPGEKFFGKGFKRFFSFKKIHDNKKAYEDVVDAGIVSGACMFLPEDVFKQVGGFDTNFFLYCEEEDLSKRVWDAKYRVCLEPRAHLVHIGGQSTKKNFKIEREFIISYFYLLDKHCNTLSSALLKLHLCLKYLFKIPKNPLYKKLFLFCLQSDKSDYSLKQEQKGA